MNLDTFSILLEVTGGQAVIKQINGVEKSLDKAESAAKKTDKANKQMGQGFRDLRSGVMRVMAPLAAFAVIVNRSIDFAKQGENLLMMANSAGVAADKFSTLALAAERLGGSRQGMAAVMSSFSAGMMGLRRGEENQLTNAAMYYGVSLSGKNGLANPEEMLFNIARAMQNRSEAEKADMARMLGLDPGTFQLVRQGIEGVRRELELADKYNPFKGESKEDMRKFMLLLREIKLAFGALSGELLKSNLPHLERWGNAIKDGIDFFLDHTDEMKLAIMGIGTAFAAALGPVYLAIWGLFILFDDLLGYFNGEKNAFEPIWERIFHLHETPEEKAKREEENKTFAGTVKNNWDVAGFMGPMGQIGLLGLGAYRQFKNNPAWVANDFKPFMGQLAAANSVGGDTFIDISTYVTTQDNPDAVGKGANKGVLDALDQVGTNGVQGK